MRHIRRRKRRGQPQADKIIEQQILRLTIQRRERLIEQHHRRINRQRARNRHPLPHPAGKLANPGMGKLTELRTRQHIAHPLAPLRFRERMMRQHQLHILRHRAPRQQGKILKNERQRVERRGRRFTFQPHHARIRRFQSTQKTQQRRFPAAGRADDADNFARLNRKRHILQHQPPVITVRHIIDQQTHQSTSSALPSSTSGTSFSSLNHCTCLSTSARFSAASGETRIAPA